jgi:hypothetical protein
MSGDRSPLSHIRGAGAPGVILDGRGGGSVSAQYIQLLVSAPAGAERIIHCAIAGM